MVNINIALTLLAVIVLYNSYSVVGIRPVSEIYFVSCKGKIVTWVTRRIQLINTYILWPFYQYTVYIMYNSLICQQKKKKDIMRRIGDVLR